MPADAQALFREGRLQDAVAAQTALVRAAPADVGARWFLAELLCFSGEWERADRLLDVVTSQAPQMMLTVLGFRQLLRGEATRREVMIESRAPQILGSSGATLYPAVEALLDLRNGQPAAAIGKLASAAAGVSGMRNGEQRFDEFRDLDDVCAGFVEFITEGGEYHWVSIADLAVLDVKPLSRPRDLIWHPARLEIKNGAAGDVYLPAIYVSETADGDDELRLGRRTDWVERDGEPVRGRGQRVFLMGEDDVPLHELGRLTFAGDETS